MPTFTMPLKQAIEFTDGTIDFSTGIAVVTGGDIGLDHYPIYDESYRATLNGKIVDHYLNREIGMETIPMFRLAMRRKMNEIMPVYNLLYKSTQIEYDPLSTVDLRTVSTGTVASDTDNAGSNETTGDTSSVSRAVSSTTPQTMLSPNEDYATGSSDSNGDTTAKSNASESSTSKVSANNSGDSHTTGYQGLPAELIMRYRQAIINVDLMIIEDLEELFMLVWNTGDTYTQNNSPYYYL